MVNDRIIRSPDSIQRYLHVHAKDIQLDCICRIDRIVIIIVRYQYYHHPK